MELRCKACGKPVDASKVDPRFPIKKCEACGVYTDFSSVLRPAPVEPASAATPLPDAFARPRASVPIPQGVTVTHEGARLVITRRWRRGAHFFLVVFAIGWFSFLGLWYSQASDIPMPFRLVFLLFPLIHVGAGCFIAYLAATGLVNTTRVEVGDGVLRIKHGPLPWPGSRELPAREVAQLYVKQNRRTSKGSVYYDYELCAVGRDQRAVKLLKGLPEGEQGLFLERAIEEKLGLADAAVAGAWTGGEST